ncbi:MAG: AMP-binding protein [Chloroflexi bacterium]|nr:AMP-binding protein [Chloroflexota bacterium]
MMDKPWLQQYDTQVPPSLKYPVLPLDHFLLHAAHKFPKRTAIITSAPLRDRQLAARQTYRQLNNMVNRFAAGLQQRQVRKGDRVAIALPNCAEFVIAAYAVWRIGGIVVGLNPNARLEDVAHVLDDSGSETLIIPQRLLPGVQSIRSRTNLRQVVISQAADFLPWPVKWNGRETVPRQFKANNSASTLSFRRVLRSKMARLKLVEVMPPDTAVILYPHVNAHNQPGISLSHRNLVCSATMSNHWLPLQPAQETVLALMPFYDSFGLTAVLTASVANAATLVLMHNPRDIGHSLQAIQQYRVTFLPGVPKLFQAVAEHSRQRQYNLSSIHLALSSKAALTLTLRQQFESLTGGRLLDAYGLTEAGGLVALDPYRNPRSDAVGVPLPDTDVQIADVSLGTEALSVGEIGEVLVRGPQVMSGYWQRPVITAEVVRTGPDGRSGWLFTGDLGYLDRDGYLHITAKRQDPLTRGAPRPLL